MELLLITVHYIYITLHTTYNNVKVLIRQFGMFVSLRSPLLSSHSWFINPFTHELWEPLSRLFSLCSYPSLGIWKIWNEMKQNFSFQEPILQFSSKIVRLTGRRVFELCHMKYVFYNSSEQYVAPVHTYKGEGTLGSPPIFSLSWHLLSHGDEDLRLMTNVFSSIWKRTEVGIVHRLIHSIFRKQMDREIYQLKCPLCWWIWTYNLQVHACHLGNETQNIPTSMNFPSSWNLPYVSCSWSASEAGKVAAHLRDKGCAEEKDYCSSISVLQSSLAVLPSRPWEWNACLVSVRPSE